MNNTSDNFSIPVPNVFKKAFHSLLLPGERLEDIFDQVGEYRSTDLELKGSIWNSKTMTLEKKKPKTLDMFFSKIKKEEHDHSEEDSTSSDKSELTKGFSPPATQKKTSTEKNAVNDINYAGKKKASLHSVSSSEEDSPGHSNMNSQIYSQDMFAEETISSKKEYRSSAEKSVSPNPVEHSGSDDEIIPSSQAHSDSNRLSLGSLSSSIRSEVTQKSNLISNKSEEVYKLPKEPVRKKSFLSSSKRRSLSPRNDSSLSEEHNKRPSFSERKSMNNSMKSVNEIFSEINLDIETLSHSDLTEDDEVYVIQCPSEIDLKQLKGLNLSLHGDSIISIGSEENNKYDCFLVKETSKRNLYVALPDGDKEEMKIGMIPLAGNIILSENLNIPFNKPIKAEGENEFAVPDETNNDISKNKKKKDRSYEDSTQDEQELSISDISINDVSKKKKKKHCTYEDYSTQDEHELSVSDVTINDISKKKHRSYEDSTQDEHELSVYNISKKKKKKHSSYEDSTQDEQEFSVSDVTVNDVPKKKKKRHKSYEDLTQYESEMSVSDVTIKDVSKKKKKKHKTNEDEIQDGTEVSECFSKSATEDVLNKLISKKKKRKNKTLGNDEINSSTTDLDKFLNIKTEWVEPQVDSGYQETNKKKRKRDMEDSVVDTEEDFIVKKEKKKHCHSGSQ